MIGLDRLQQIVVDAAGQQVAVKPHVIGNSGGDDHRAGLTHVGQRVDVVQRIGAIRQINQQDLWPRCDR